MKNITCYLILLISSTFVFSQSNQIPTGSYYSEDEGTGFYFIVNDKNEFQLSISQGKITTDTISNLELKKQKTPIFGVKYIEEDPSKDSLSITFPKGFKNYHLNQIFIATKNSVNDTPAYIQASELNKTDFYKNDDFKLKIKKSKFILLLEETYNKETNILYEYELPKKVSKIKITYHPSKTRNIKLHATYNSIDKTVIVNENGRNNPITFYKDFDKHLDEFKTPNSITKDIIWRNEETIKPVTSAYKSLYKYELKTFSNFENALQTAKNDNKLLLAFYLPEGSKNEENYTTFIKNYEQKLSNMMYDRYKTNYDKFRFYLIPKTDKKHIEKFDLKENELIVLDGIQSIIYRHKASIAELSKEIMDQISSYSRNDFKDMQLMKRLDDAILAKKFNAIETQRIFNNITSITAYDFFSGHESNLEKTYRENEYIKNNSIYYTLQSNLNQVNNLFEKLIDSHKEDATIDFEFAS
ncbi:hypothetical protein, partial [Psychroserpens damuponensis]|uniref:hypothetical protein n=1 Tax=Psychroserpens damuponensis TaxID=943936 RepID=UPI0012699AA5